MKDPNDRFGALCDDCERGVLSSGHSLIASNLSPRDYCLTCYRTRAAVGLEFDPRPWVEIQAQRLRDLDVDPEGETRGVA